MLKRTLPALNSSTMEEIGSWTFAEQLYGWVGHEIIFSGIY